MVRVLTYPITLPILGFKRFLSDRGCIHSNKYVIYTTWTHPRNHGVILIGPTQQQALFPKSNSDISPT